MPLTYFEALDVDRLFQEYLVGDSFVSTYTRMSRDELRALQELRFKRVIDRAWQTSFYIQRWRAAGIEPGDIRSLEDLPLLPVYDKADIMESVERRPPLGDFTALDSYAAEQRPPIVLQMTSGTTGAPQPLLSGSWGREVANLLVGRMFRWLGVNADDVVHSVYGHGLTNGGHYMREAIIHFTEAVFLSAGTGVETRSVRQVDLMHRYQTTVLAGFSDYLRRLAEAARAAGLEPGVDIPVRMIVGHLPGGVRKELEAAWNGAPAFDWYGVADTGSIAGEGPDRNGLYVWEDAHWVEILSDDGSATGAGEDGDLVVTCLYKDDIAPVVRLNTHDVSRWWPDNQRGELVFRRIAGFLGRSDNMVKVRGINVYPHAIGAILARMPAATGEYYCRATAQPDGREELSVVVEHREPYSSEQREVLEAALRDNLGITVAVELVAPGTTASITGLETRQKPLRLVNERP